MCFSLEDCVVIEDSTYGAHAATAGGFDVLIYANEQKKKNFSVEGQIYFDKMEELNNILYY